LRSGFSSTTNFLAGLADAKGINSARQLDAFRSFAKFDGLSYYAAVPCDGGESVSHARGTAAISGRPRNRRSVGVSWQIVAIAVRGGGVRLQLLEK
jgi:hypothetical protein